MKNQLPGDLTPQQRLARMIRVDHAGEYGARRIYEGQLAVLGKKPCGPTIQHMMEQELQHLAYFEQELPKRQVRPTALQPVWHVAGFALGMATALMGEKAAMACTIAVEETIDAHYGKQLESLEKEDPALAEKIAQFRAEELEHRNTAIAHDGEKAPGYKVLSHMVKTASRTAIWLSERI